MYAETDKRQEPTRHSVSLAARSHMEIYGVTDVLNFDEETVLISTVCGNMEITGNTLHIHVLSMEDGIVTLDGRVDSVTYYDTPSESKGGFFSKLFH